jgi:predicted methyltransferase
MKRLAVPALLALLGSACGGSQPAPADPATDVTPAPVEPAEPAVADPAATDAAAEQAKAAAEEQAKAAEQAARAAQALAELEAETATEAARWTPALHQQAAALMKKKFKTTKAALAAILKSPIRMPGHAARDAARHPVETLDFFGVRPGMKVVEMGAGEGWYTELLAPLVGAKGQLVVLAPDRDGPSTSTRTVYGKRTAALLAKSPELFANATVVTFDPPAKATTGVEGADVVVAMREMHGWQRRGQMDAYLAAVHAMLKEGGVFGVEQHRAAPGTEPTGEQGYLPEAWVIEKVEAAGFTLAEKSEINANPKDTKDYAKGVWTLPPNFAEGDADKAKYEAIGESDRMTLKFVKKPAAK